MPVTRPLGLPVLFVDSAAPAATDDVATIGARPGYTWVWAGRWWLCRDAATSGAIWDELATVAGMAAAYQPLDADLTAIAGLSSNGLVERTGAGAAAIRALGVGASTSVPTRADGDARWAALSHTHAWSAIVSGLPTTLAGYGISDAAPLSHVGAGGVAHANVVAGGAAGFMAGADKTKLDGIAAGAQPGTVTSIALSVPAIFSLSGSPITTSGTLTVALATQAANLVFAGPSSGSAVAPSFRALAVADIPALPWSQITSGKPTTLAGYGIGDAQPLDADLTALAALTATAGILARTGAGAFAVRTLTAPAAGLTIADGAGVTGNPTFALANDLAALEALGAAGIAVRTGADTWAQRSIVQGDGIVVTFGDGVSGNPAVALTGVALSLHLNTTGPGADPLDVPRAVELGTAAWWDADALRGVLVEVQNANYQITPQDHGKLFLATSGAPTYSLPLAADVGPFWCVRVKARGTTITLARGGSDQIDGGTSASITTGQSCGVARSGGTSMETFS